MKEYSQMSREELCGVLNKLREDLEEVTEEREMMLFGTTGLHRSVGHLVKKYAEEIEELNTEIQAVNEILSTRTE